jgi:hypothetical protein
MSAMKKIWILGLLSLAVTATSASSGCAAQQADDEPAPAASEDDLSFGAGSVDHAAIVEVTTMMLVGDPTEFATVLDPYNQDDPFKIRSTSYVQPFMRNLTKFDNSDNHIDWTQDQAATWTSRVAAGNYLVIDTSMPCDFANPHTYLELERAQMTGRAHTTCGGRMPNEDALDVTVNFLVRGPAASAEDDNAIHDGVEEATKQASNTFPYLGEMNGF